MNNPATALSPEAFMAQPPEPEDDLVEDVSEALARSVGPAPDRMWLLPSNPLESIASSLEEIAGHFARLDGADEYSQRAAELLELQREYAEIEALHDAKQALIDEVLQVCSKSTSKLANSIRAVLEPPVEPAQPVEPQPAEPTPDADVEVWRAFARGRGYQGADVDTMNRSQIRTMLGIEQPAPGEGDEA